MTSLRWLGVVVLVSWLVVDNAVVLRRRTRPARQGERLSLLFIALAGWFGVASALSLGFAGVGSLGEAYAAYRSRTDRLVPGVF